LKNAIIVFTKVPKVGVSKTRLTVARGGLFTPEEAKDFYEACLLDVIDHCVSSDSGDVYICHDNNGDSDYLKQLLTNISNPQAIKGIFKDAEGTFDQCMQYAADYILKKGQAGRLADSVLLVGGDLPCLQPSIIKDAVSKMKRLASTKQGLAVAMHSEGIESSEGAAMVTSACQEGGFSMIGFTCTTPFDFDGVFYNEEGITALDFLVQKTSSHDIPFGLVEAVPDVDIPVDIASQIPVLKALQLAGKYDATIALSTRTIKFLIDEMGIESSAMPPQR